ncbi:hypothetical protein CCO03_18650 [Comamonas serinivorans]|uniref:PLD phosphodiesterase domain-containing protein n=1 Tax=Comamonas serinivorans TaxID=1082851 RepID=A0A1Y0ESY1_9BURK|nr:phospholipase D family protein [Comamonas serinivorans]ARU06409.1 hypothetical protein CCO03_18650 [Comamonas serinivorans]
MSYDSPSPSRYRPLWLLVLLCCLSALQACQSLPRNVVRPSSQAWASPQATPLGELVRQRRAQAGAQPANGFALLPGADEAYSARLALIEQARHTLDLQYYTVNLDASSASLLEALTAAAQRGVRVRLLLDDFNTAGRNAQVLRLAFVPGVEVRLFNPLPGSRNSLLTRTLGALPHFARMQQRMHNKLFLADNAVGITGGRNLGDAYFGLGDSSNFVDLDVLAFGPIVQDMGRSFDQYWNNTLAYPVQSLVSQSELNNALSLEVHAGDLQSATDTTMPPARDVGSAVRETLQAMRAKAAHMPPAMNLREVPLHWVPAQLIVDRPGKISAEDHDGGQDTVVDGMVSLMGEARRDVLLVTPYFVPGPQIMKTFEALRARGVRVRVLTNSLASNDAVAAHAGYARYRKDLVRLGVELHELRGVAIGASGEVRSGALLSGSGSGTRGGSRTSVQGAHGPAGSTATEPQADGSPKRLSLHAKFVALDDRLLLVGSMNLDLRSKLQNTEIGLLLASRALSRDLTRLTELAFERASYRVELDGEQLRWRAPPGANFQDTTSEPDASMSLRLLANVIAPFAPDELL